MQDHAMMLDPAISCLIWLTPPPVQLFWVSLPDLGKQLIKYGWQRGSGTRCHSIFLRQICLYSQNNHKFSNFESAMSIQPETQLPLIYYLLKNIHFRSLQYHLISSTPIPHTPGLVLPLHYILLGLPASYLLLKTAFLQFPTDDAALQILLLICSPILHSHFI